MDSCFTDEETLTLLKLVHSKDIQDRFNSNKKKHRKVWEEISQTLAQQGIEKSAVKCQNRYENTKRAYNAIKRNRSAASPKPNYAFWDFWESIVAEKRTKIEEHYKQKESESDLGGSVPRSCRRVVWNRKETPFFTDRETDELLLIMGESATRQMFVKHPKKHRIAWNYIVKRLKEKGINKTVVKLKNR